LHHTQNKLFNIGAYLATPNTSNAITKCNGLRADDIEILEKAIDKIDMELPQLTNFVLPGGAKRAALAHVCRTVCRRAERRIVALAEETFVDPTVLKYVNRLSDFLFVFSRYINVTSQIDELLWNKDC
jgi:cob(I)alamin adenosyltransferase